MKVATTAGQVSSYSGYAETVDGDLPGTKILIADQGGSTILTPFARKSSQTAPPSPHPAETAKTRPPIDDFLYALRNRIERCINRLKNARRLAPRYDKTATSYLGFIETVAAHFLYKHLPT